MKKIERALDLLHDAVHSGEIYEKDVQLLKAARAELTQLKELLKGMEWPGPSWDDTTYCRVCLNNYEQGHKPDCQLAEILKEE